MDDLSFCPACGKELPYGTTYCPACGVHLSDPTAVRTEDAVIKRKSNGDLNVALILLLITAAASIIGGLVLYFYAEPVADWIVGIVNDPAVTDAEFIDFMIWVMQISGLMVIAGGAVAIISAALVHKRRMWTLTFIMCLIAALIGNFLFGIIAAYLVYKAKPAFTD